MLRLRSNGRPKTRPADVAPVPPKRRMLRLEYERRIRKLGVREVGRLVGSDGQRIAKVECGSARPGRSLAARLAKLFSLDCPERVMEEVRP